MKKLPKNLLDKTKKYSTLDDTSKLVLLERLYNGYQLSWGVIAEMCDTYPNKIRRDAKKLGLKSRTKAEAQKLALNSGRHTHPTEGVGHSKEAKIKISESVAHGWGSMTPEEREAKRETARRVWAEKSDEEIKAIREAAGKGVRKAAKEGSAFEKHLMEKLVGAGYSVEFHKKHWVIREKLEIDLYIPKLSVAIEVDGPSHFEDIWGKDALTKNQSRDNEKTGLLLERGCVIIRVKQTKPLSNKYKRDTVKDVIDALKSIEKKRPAKGKRTIFLGE